MTGQTGRTNMVEVHFCLQKDFYYFMAALNAKAFKVPRKWWLLILSSCLVSEGHGVLHGCGAPL